MSSTSPHPLLAGLIAPFHPLQDFIDIFRDPGTWFRHYLSKWRGSEIPSVGTPAPSLTVLIYSWLGAFIGILCVSLISYEAHVPAIVGFGRGRLRTRLKQFLHRLDAFLIGRIIRSLCNSYIRNHRVSFSTTAELCVGTATISVLGNLCSADDVCFRDAARRDRLEAVISSSKCRVRCLDSHAGASFELLISSSSENLKPRFSFFQNLKTRLSNSDYKNNPPTRRRNSTHRSSLSLRLHPTTLLHALDFYRLAGRARVRCDAAHRAVD